MLGIPGKGTQQGLEETGAAHCQCDNPTLGKEYACDWLADKLSIDQPSLPPKPRQPWV